MDLLLTESSCVILIKIGFVSAADLVEASMINTSRKGVFSLEVNFYSMRSK